MNGTKKRPQAPLKQRGKVLRKTMERTGIKRLGRGKRPQRPKQTLEIQVVQQNKHTHGAWLWNIGGRSGQIRDSVESVFVSGGVLVIGLHVVNEAMLPWDAASCSAGLSYPV